MDQIQGVLAADGSLDPMNGQGGMPTEAQVDKRAAQSGCSCSSPSRKTGDGGDTKDSINSVADLKGAKLFSFS